MNRTIAARFASLTLGHVGREYPHLFVHEGDGPDTLRPSALHPIFHGSYDWHSCVHGWWQLIRLVRLFPDLEAGAEIRARADRLFTPENVAREEAYFERHPAFERPYGWAWLLALHRELRCVDTPWAGALDPLARTLGVRLAQYVSRLSHPVRSGVHSNTAFALILALAWADAEDPALFRLFENRAEWFAEDRACAAQEPSGEDFLSPTLVEALYMARVLPPAAFPKWFASFLPELPKNLLEPVRDFDRTDGRIGHLDGLNLSRAWCWRSLAPHLAEHREKILNAAERHQEVALPHLADGYMGEHWLATFALLALTA